MRHASQQAIAKLSFLLKSEAACRTGTALLDAWVENRLDIDEETMLERLAKAIIDQYGVDVGFRGVKMMHDQRCGRAGAAWERSPFNTVSWEIRGPKARVADDSDKASCPVVPKQKAPLKRVVYIASEEDFDPVMIPEREGLPPRDFKLVSTCIDDFSNH